MALERFGHHLDRPGDIHTTILFLALCVVALHGVGHHAQAEASALRLLHLAAGEGHIRVYLNVGEPMRQVMEYLHDQLGVLDPPASAFVARLLTASARAARRARITASWRKRSAARA